MIGLLSTTWLHFQSFPLLYAGRESYAEASTMSNSVNLMQVVNYSSTMGDNFAERFWCPPEQVVKYYLHTIRTANAVHYTE